MIVYKRSVAVRSFAAVFALILRSCSVTSKFPTGPTSDFAGGCVDHYYTNQTLDHFNDDDTRVFGQRYFICDRSVGDNPPIIVFLGGESDVNSGDAGYTKSFRLGELSRSIGGVFIVLEHRYYGFSYPFEDVTDVSTEKLTYLTSQQALADVEQFLLYLKGLEKGRASDASTPALTLKHSLADSKVVTWSGSYPGNLAAWARMLYPEVVSGAVALSAPVLAAVELPISNEFAGHLKLESIGGSAACFEFWDNALFSLASKLMDSPSDLPQGLRPCTLPTPMSAEDAVSITQALLPKLTGATGYYDYVSNPEQGDELVNGPRKWCQVAEENMNAPEGEWDALKELFAASGLNDTCIASPSQSTSTANSTAINELGNEVRDNHFWHYQMCSEFGYMQPLIGSSGPESVAMRFMALDPTNTLDASVNSICSPYGPDYTVESVHNAVRKTNDFYGGRQLKVDNVSFINGGVDAWRVLSILPDDVEYFEYCPDAGLSNTDSSKCLQNPELTSVYFVEIGPHVDEQRTLYGLGVTSNGEWKYQYMNPEWQRQSDAVWDPVLANVRSYLGINTNDEPSNVGLEMLPDGSYRESPTDGGGLGRGDGLVQPTGAAGRVAPAAWALAVTLASLSLLAA